MATLGTRGDRLNLLIRKGGTFGPFPMTLTDNEGNATDLTGATVRAKIRKAYEDATAYVVTCALTVPLAGQFTITMPPTDTSAIPYLGDFNDPDNQYVWDLEILYPDTSVQPVFWGAVRIVPEATT